MKRRQLHVGRRSLLKGAMAMPFMSLPAVLPTGAWAQDSGPLRFHILSAMTGTGTTFGTGLMAGARTAIDEINAAGGVLGRQIEVITSDTGTDASRAAVAFQDQLTKARPHAAFHAGSTAEAGSVGPLAARENVPYFTVTDIEDIVDASRFRPVFSVQSAWSDVARVFAQMAADAGVKTMTILAGVDGTGEGVIQYFPDAAKEAGIEIVGVERFRPTDLDMTSQLRKLESINPDAHYIEASGAPSGYILQGLIRLGITRPVICGKAMGASNLEGLVDASLLPNVVIANHAVSNRGEGGRGDSALVEAAMPKFLEYSGGQLVTSLYIYSWGYDAVKAWAAAITEAGSADTDAIVQVLESWTDGSPSAVEFMSRDNFAFTPEKHLPLADPSAYGFAKLGTLDETGTREAANFAID